MTTNAEYTILLDFLLEAYSAHPGVYLSVREADLELARGLLRTLVTDAEALEEYVQKVNGAINGAVPPPDFTFEAACLDVVEYGLARLSPAFLGMILLDPLAVINIHTAIERDTPDFWRNHLRENGIKLIDQHSLVQFGASLTFAQISQIA
jgi:hypothetical protein